MDIKVGNCRYSIKLTTVGKNQSYTVHVDFHDTYREFTLAGIDADAGAAKVIVSSDECVDHKTIIIREEDGHFKVDMEPRIVRRPSRSAATRVHCEPARRRLSSFLRLWIF